MRFGGIMKKLFTKKNILTIPNFLSLLRILMIPVIVWLYLAEKNPCAAAAVVILSGLTDIADGIIARKFNMISDFGKILDPIADKLTQVALIVSLSMTPGYEKMLWLVGLFIVKESIVALLGYITLRNTDSVESAKWYGKLSTFVLYASIIALILFPSLPIWAVYTIIIFSSAVLCLSLVMYTRFFIKILCKQ